MVVNLSITEKGTTRRSVSSMEEINVHNIVVGLDNREHFTDTVVYT
jgi:hypothetical protein